MKRNNIYMAAVAIAVALAFVMPGAAAVANVGKIGVTSDIENTIDMETMVEISTNSDTIETSINTEDLVIDPRREPIVIDVEKLGSVDREEPPVIDVEKLSTEIDASSIVSATGNTIYVDDDADPSWYNETQVKTVLEGVVNASAGDTVYVYNGIYPNEAVLVNKTVDLTGESKENVILEGGGFEAGNVITVTANHVNVTNFTIRNCRTGINLQASSSSNTVTNCDVYLARNGILIYSSNNIITNCNVYDISTYSVRIDGANYNTLINCSIHDSTYYGLYMDECSYNSIINCSVYNHTNRGIRLNGDDEARSIGNSFIGCEVYNNAGHGIYLDYFCDYTNFTNCDIYDNYYSSDTSPGVGIYIRCWPGDSSYANITNCNIYDNDEYGLHLARARHATLRHNTIYDNNKNFGITASSVADFYMDIDPSNTINGKPMYYIVNQNDLELDGYNFGYLGLVSCTNITVRNADTYGILLVDTVDATIFNVSSHQVMEGVWATWGSSNIDLVNCTFYDNSWGISFTSISNIDVINCTAYDNTESGIQIDSCLSINVTDSNFYNNALGMFLDHSQNVAMVGNEIDNNVANFHVDGTGGHPEHFVHDIDTSNTINGKPMYYLVGQSNLTIDETDNPGFVGLVFCTNITAKNADTSGILLVETTYSTISNVSSHNSIEGIQLQTSTYNIITNCDSYNNSRRNINLFYYSSNNDIIDSNFYNSSDPDYGGICFWSYNINNNFINCSSYNNAGYGIYFTYDSDNNNFTNCEIYNNNDRGIYIDSAANLKFRDNSIYNNVYNFDVLESFDTHDIDASNTINGKPMYYLIGQSNITLDGNFGYLGLISCTNITAKNSDVSGILLVGTTDSTISNVSSHNSVCGILLEESPNSNIMDFTSYNNYDGIYLDDSLNSNLTNCDVYNNIHYGINARYSEYCNFIDCDSDNNEYGIYIYRSHYSNFIDCDFSNNVWDGAYARCQDSNFINCSFHDNGRHGIQFTSSNAKYCTIDSSISYNNENGITFWSSARYNNVINSTVYDNTYGIYVYATSAYSNLLHHNNFVNNLQNAYDPALNTWDDGTEGNYWDDYTGVDVDPEDGIGDTPYNISGGSNQDRYPLMEPILEAPELLLPPDGSGTEDLTPTFDWTDIKPLYPVTYTLLVANDTGFSNIIIEETGLTESEYTPTEDMPADITYYWKVNASVGIYDTEWSETWSFFIGTDLTPPTTPDLIEPTDESTTVEPMIFFDWTDAYDYYGIDYYILQVATDDAFDDIVAEETPADSECALALATADDYYWRVQAVDNNGLIGDWSETWMFSRMVDTTPPTVELTYPVGGEDLRGTVEITWTATDDYTSELLIDIDYRCGGDWQVMSSGEENDGTYTWDTTLYPDSEYYVIRVSTSDKWDNVGFAESYPAITVDNTAPVTTVDLYPADPDGENNWYTSNVHVVLLATDEPGMLFATGEPFGFGVNYTMYRLNEGSWQEYDVPFTVTEDDDGYTLEFYSVDYAGNEETVKSVNFKIDKTAPTIDLTVEKTGLIKWLLTATVSDETSGVAKVEFYLDAERLGEVTDAPYDWECSERGTAHAIVYDNAGNEAMSDPVPVSYSQSQSQSNSNLVPVQRKISLILDGLTVIQNTQRRV